MQHSKSWFGTGWVRMHNACPSGCLGACDVLEEKPDTMICAASWFQILLFSNAKQYKDLAVRFLYKHVT